MIARRYVTDLVERHLKYGVELVHYDIVLETMKSVLGTLLGTALTPDDAAAWSRVIDIIKVVARHFYKA
jgi:hemoglobin-like flavoprotein